MSSVKKNFGYNLVLTLCGYIFPFITYPYVSRVLGVQNIGICNFADSIINYFVLFSMLGVGSYGVREIARVREDEERRSAVFSNLIIINFISTLISIVVLVICTYEIPKLTEYKPFLLIGIAKLLFNMFLIEWFYQGMQEFKYITLRSLLVRIIYVISIFIFIHEREDVIIYFLITTLTIVLNAVVNWIHARKYIKISFHHLKVRSFFIPILTFGYYRILTSMYTTFNTVFLGVTSGDIEVGYFATATKLYSIIMSVLAAFTTVMIPKVSELLQNGQREKIQWIADQTLSVITVISIPVIIYCNFCAVDIISLLAGPGYEGAVISFRIVIFLLLIIGFEQVLIQQFLMASQKTIPVMLVSTVGAVVGITANIILTPRLGATGSSIAWGVSELSVLLTGIVKVKKGIGITISTIKIIKDVIWSFLYMIPLFVVSLFNLGLWSNLIISGFIVSSLFVIINLWLHKNEQVITIVYGILSRLKIKL